MQDAATGNTLFGSLPANIFRLFSGRARWFYADLLDYLATSVFVDGIMVARSEVLDAIRDFADRYALEATEDGEGEADVDFLAASDGLAKAQIAYARLLSTGWIVEHRDRYRRIADIEAAARPLLDTLLDIKSGRLRSYGGEVLQVLSLLEAAHGDPENRSEAIRNASRSAKSFMGHLRSVGSAMRKAEEAIVAQRDVGSLFRTFFDDFVAKHLVEDYKRLHTQSNPFRFRVRIMEITARMEADDILLRQLGEGYAREGRASDVESGIETVYRELSLVQRVFGELDAYLDLIGDTNRRIERRIRNTVRFMDRIAETRTERITLAFRALAAAADMADDAPVDLPARQLAGDLPLGLAHLYQASARRAPVGPRAIRRPEPDPAFLAYQKALQEYRARTTVTPRRIADYLERAMDGRDAIDASALPLHTLDDFFVFERLRDLEFVEGGALAGEFLVTRASGTIENGWISCPDFTISRRRGNADVR